LLMRIQHAAQHQFAARVDEFNIHAIKFQLRSSRWQVRENSVLIRDLTIGVGSVDGWRSGGEQFK
jgi:hypothetical protein